MAVAKRKCPACKSYNRPDEGLMIHNRLFCNIDCATGYGKKTAPKGAKKLKQHRARKKREFYDKDVKTRREAAIREFNRYIRMRDRGKGCISCGKDLQGKFDAGHYKAAGSCTALRFDESNVHGQCVRCNQHLSGNLQEYRVNLVARVGAKVVARLEGPQPTIKITADWYREVEETYKAKCKAMEKGEAA